MTIPLSLSSERAAKRVLRPLVVAILIGAVALGLVGVAHAKERHVLVLEVNGIINQVTERFIAREVRRAEEDEATLIIIKLDTPGGLLDSTRKITQHLLNADVPSVVYVTPRGAQAASAGTFITAAATFAVMAPGTNIGAASPVGSSGEDLPQTLKSKAFSDAAAEMRGIATLRGRNAEKLEATVLQALSFTADEAVKSNLVDFIASDMDDLLAQLNGREAQLRPPTGPKVVLDTQNVVMRTTDMSLVDQLLRFLADPNIAFLLLSLGGLGLLVELISPGLIAPGVVGAILLVVALVVLGSLSVNWAGVVLILMAIALAVLEVYVGGFGILGIGAIVSFVLGGFLLFFHGATRSPTMPSLSVSLWVLVPTVAVLAGGGGWVIWTMIKSRREQGGEDTPRVLGATGYSATELAPRGVVQVAGEQWSAVSADRTTIPAGQEVRVTGVSGATVTVVRVGTGGGDTETEGRGI
ncbi:MAG: nodulation protein NfeD [Dehalococcoidia bacterium]|nr:nodulation protein NfeD [Dehalococcoidia bacterium]